MAERKMRLAIGGDYTKRYKPDEVIERIVIEFPLFQELFAYEFLPQTQDGEEIEGQYLEDFDALLLSSQRVGARTVTRAVADRLIAVARAGSGVDNIDLNRCTDADILAFNSPHGLAHSVALGALTLLLCAGRKALILDRLVREGRWGEQMAYIGADYLGHTLGLVGVGRIGRELMRLLAPFKMRVLTYDPYVTPEAAAAAGAESVPLPTLMRESDFVCVACSLTPETAGMVSAEMLALMKPTAFLLNVARGAIVDQDALTQALQERRIAGAALDVFVEEPLPPDHPLTRLDNVVLSPHFASSSRDMGRRTTRDWVNGLVALAHGELPDNVVNPEVLSRHGFQAKLARWQRGQSIRRQC